MIFLKSCLLLTFAIIILNGNANAQKDAGANTYLKLSSGRIIFGTGDIVGPGVSIEGGKNLIRKPKRFLQKLYIGSEFSFQFATSQPKVENPTPADFLYRMFNHQSLFALNTKLTYHPFGKVLRGFYLSGGPTVAYTAKSYERSAELAVYTPVLSRRISELKFENEFLVGYLVSPGYEFEVAKNWMVGLRFDLINYRVVPKTLRK